MGREPIDVLKNLSTVLKLTKQRETIASVFFSQNGHKKAEEILSKAREIDARISLATVYRTLKILQDHGLAESHNFLDGQALFEPKLEEDQNHDHLICTRCQKIEEFFDEHIESLQKKIAKERGFKISDHRHELYGLCRDCD